MKFAIGHVRVSTNKQFDHGESIDTQKQRIEEAAARAGYVIVRWFVEHYSGRKNERIIIDDMLAYLADNQDDIRAVFIYQIDRLTRGGSDNYLYLRKKLYELGAELIDTQGIIQKKQNALAHTGFTYSWSEETPSRTSELMTAELAYSGGRDILVRLIGRQIDLTKGGYHCRPSNIGYKNAKIMTDDGKKYPILVPHETEGAWLVKMFDLRAEGQLSDEEICERLNAMGFKTRKQILRDPKTRKVIGTKGDVLLNPKILDRYIANPIYCGIRVEKWTNYEPIKNPYPGLVSIDVFNRANRGKVFIQEVDNDSIEIKYNYRKYRRSPDNPEFQLRHVVNCPKCNDSLWGSYSANRVGIPYGYYHCDRGHKRFSVPKAVFEQTVGNYLKKLELKPAFLGIFKESVRAVWQEKNKAAQVEIDAAENHTNKLKARQELLLEKIEQISSSVVLAKLEAEIEGLENQIKNTALHKDTFEVKPDQINAYFDFIKNQLEHPHKSVENALPRAKLEKVWRLIFSSTPTYEELESGTAPLSLLYRLNQSPEVDQSNVVEQIGKHWNQFEADLKRFVSS